MADEVRTFAFWSIDEDGNGTIDGDGLEGFVKGAFPLSVGDKAFVLTRGSTYLGSDGEGGGIFQDVLDLRVFYLSDTNQLSEGDPIPDPVNEPLPFDPEEGGDGGETGDGVPVISVVADNAVQDEGNDGTTDFTFKVTRSGQGLSEPSSADLVFVSGETNANDFGGTPPSSQQVEFAANETEKSVSVAVSGDTLVEADESFLWQLANPEGATINESASSAVGTIINDDAGEAPPPVISLLPSNTFQQEGNEGSTIYSFLATRSGADLSGDKFRGSGIRGRRH